MTPTLGEELRKLREARGMKLREVEKESGISNGYLTQLENNKIKEPSPNILHKLSVVYEVPYNKLMKAAGYVAPSQNSGVASNATKKEDERSLSSFALSSANLTPDEEEALLDYLKYLKFKKKKK
jgi:transcriptional regulator with XRE-family HTH domain